MAKDFEIAFDELKFIGNDPRTKERAWHITLEKWETLVEWYQEHSKTDDRLYMDSPGTCGLCMMYNTEEDPCVKCPIKAKTGKKWCIGTPFEQFTDYSGNKESLKHSRRELRFLKKVYEEGKK